MEVAAVDAGRLPEMLARMRRYGPQWIMKSSLLFPTPVATSGETQVYGKPGARLSRKEDVVEVRTQCVLSVLILRAAPWDSRLGLEYRMALVVPPSPPTVSWHRRRREPVAHLPSPGAPGWRCNRVSAP